MISALAVKWECHGKSIKEHIVKGIRSIVEGELSEIGYNGIWVVKPIRQVDKRGNDRSFIYKLNRQEHSQHVIIALCQPKGPDTCWEVSILPPSDYDILDIAATLGKQKSPKPKQSKGKQGKPSILESARNSGRVFRAVVKAILPHGLSVELDGLKINGLIPIEHLSADYDRGKLKEYKVGQGLKVCVASVKGPKFSVVGAEVLTGTKRISDVFAGIPESDGKLRLSGYVKSLERRFDVIEWLKPLIERHYPKAIPRDAAIDVVLKGLATKYKAEYIERKSVGSILNSLCVSDKLLELDSNRDFLLTERGTHAIGIPQAVPEPELPEPQPEQLGSEPAEHSVQTPIVEYMVKMEEMARIIVQVRELERRKAELVQWLIDHLDDLGGIVKQIPEGN